MSTNRRAKRTPACFAMASLRPWVSWMPILGEGDEAAVEVGAAELVGDEQRLARGVGGRVGQAVLEHLERARRSRSTAATPAGRRRRPGRSSAGPRRPTSNRAWGIDRPSEPVRMRISSISRGHASWALGEPAGAALPVRRGREPGRREGRRRRARQRRRRRRRRRAAPPTSTKAASTPRSSPYADVIEPGLDHPARGARAASGGGTQGLRDRGAVVAVHTRCTPVAASIEHSRCRTPANASRADVQQGTDVVPGVPEGAGDPRRQRRRSTPAVDRGRAGRKPR